MADDQDKAQQTEEPTQKRLDQAREQGDTVKSSELSAFVLLGGGTLAIAMFGPYTANGLAKLLMVFLEQPETMAVDGAGLAAISRGVLYHMAMTLAPFFGVMMLAALAGHLIQGLPTGDMVQLVIELTSSSFALGFQLAAPFLVFGFAVYAGLGVLAKLMPQLQIFFVAVPINIVCGFLIMLALIGSLMTVFLNYYATQMAVFL